MPRKKLPLEEKVMRANMSRRKYMDKHQNILVRKSTAEKLEEIGAALNLSLRDTVEMLVELHLIKGDPMLLSRLAKKKKKKHKHEKLKASPSAYNHFGVSGDASHALSCDMTPADTATAAAWVSGDRDMMVSGDLMYDRLMWNVGPSSDELLKKNKRREHKRLKAEASAFAWDPHSGVSGDPLMGSGDPMYDYNESAWNIGSGSDEVSKNKRKRREPRKLKSSTLVVDGLTGMSGDRAMLSGDPSHEGSGWNGVVPAADGLLRSALEGGRGTSDGAARSGVIGIKMEPEDNDESEICQACCLEFPTPGDFLAHQQIGCVSAVHKDNDTHQQQGSEDKLHKDNDAHSSNSSHSKHEDRDLQNAPEKNDTVHSTPRLSQHFSYTQDDADLQKKSEETKPLHSTHLPEPSASQLDETYLQMKSESTKSIHFIHPPREPLPRKLYKK